ncbi:hypothetical protein GCM10010377_82960 [Streptomyces viridiviolaceus]|uniref:Uncharacterized protein n=1 Tax=Streptomyces viridiviolaceus TaxID=68282 RepID=A0ABW2E0B0_9ACTN|nr:hypothetical protein [Streptomyces viridiviolaceus]GHB80641.1 hypothetical protein GCM10010377_82960 [Streptomyces viridiviolaceus]
MLETYLSWYCEGRMDESEFRSVTNHLAQSGLTVEHPMLGCGMLLDVVGEQVKLPVGRILELVGLSVGPLCMQFWLSADTDVVCDVRYVAPDTQVLTFVLGGLTENEREQATNAVQRLIQRELDRTVALLVDLGGETANEDDDALVLYGRLPMGPRPDRLQFRTDRLSAVPAVLAGAEVTDLGNGLSTVRW